MYVWQMGHMCGLWWQAGWSLRLVEGFIWDRAGKGGGSQDSNMNTHTSFPINKSPAFHHSSSPCVSWGGSEGGLGVCGGWEGYYTGVYECKFYF